MLLQRSPDCPIHIHWNNSSWWRENWTWHDYQRQVSSSNDNVTHFLLRVKCLLSIQLKITVSWWHTDCWIWKLRIRSIPVVRSRLMPGDRVLVLRFAWESDTWEIWIRRLHFRLPVFRPSNDPENLKHTYQSIEEPACRSGEYMIDSTRGVFTAPQGHL
jgi:hypothetical protein